MPALMGVPAIHVLTHDSIGLGEDGPTHQPVEHLAALRAIPGLYCVTDSTSAAGMPDGDYRLGRHVVTKCLGAVRLADGTLAGSALTMDQALRNLVEVLGLSIAEASRRTSTIAAGHAGAQGRGVLCPGAFADLVVLDRTLRVQQVVVEGETVSPPPHS